MESLRYLRIMLNSIITRYMNYNQTKYDQPLLVDDYIAIPVKSYEHKLTPSLRARSKAQPSIRP